MSQTQYIEFHERGFWTYDVAFGVLAKHFLDAAAAHPSAGEPWLVDVVDRLRRAVMCNYGMTFDASMSPQKVAIVIDVMSGACAALSTRDEISRSEVESWDILADASGPYRIETRGHSSIRTVHAIAVGKAVVELLRGSLPDAKSGHDWLYGVEDTPIFIGKTANP